MSRWTKNALLRDPRSPNIPLLGILFLEIFSQATFEIFPCTMHTVGHFHSASIMENVARIMEKSGKNHGISFWEMAGNPEIPPKSASRKFPLCGPSSSRDTVRRPK